MSTRRSFLQTAGSAVAGTALVAQDGRTPTTSANDKIQIALIGAGGMGSADVLSTLNAGGTALVAACDVYNGRLTRAKEIWGNQVFTTRDYREVLARKDVDAVIIGTPDHWHSRIAVEALNSGKDVYLEKPMVHKLDEGKLLIEAQTRSNRILQVGSQRVSSIVYEKAKDLISEGAIGEVNLIEAWWDRNSAIGAWQTSIPLDATPENIDWDRFLGHAPKRSFDPVRLFRWRTFQDYGTGVAGDLFVHLFSGMHYIMGSLGPTRVFSTGGLRFWKDGRDVPDVLLGLYDYPETKNRPGFNLALRVNFVNGAAENSGFRFVGSEGVLTVGNGVTVAKQPRESEPGFTIDYFSKSQQQEFLKKYREKYPLNRPSADAMRPLGENKYQAPPGYSDHLDHHRNWHNAIRTRKPVVEDAVFGFRAAGPALLSNISYFEQRICQWDPESMTLRKG